ncbi:MAG: CAP domain-containing protein [Candidatus Cloacimonas sp.]|jgi:uncharacterized protein YkwD|nr:CAP domain-containing protein [Candidatus Cloacimonas sp.]
MKNALLIIILCLFASFLCASRMTITEFEKQVLQLTNAERVKYNLQPLAYDEGLADLSRLHSRNMLNLGFFAHKDQFGDMVSERKNKYYPQLVVSSIGENLARFYNTKKFFSPAEIVDGWMNSPAHRENILHADYTHLGVGVVLSGETMLATQSFATPLVKLLTLLPKKFSRKQKYTLEFEYMSPNPASEFGAVLDLPDSEFRYQIDASRYTVGTIPLHILWIDPQHFSLEISFVAGRGLYLLDFGFNNAYFEDGIRFLVR